MLLTNILHKKQLQYLASIFLLLSIPTKANEANLENNANWDSVRFQNLTDTKFNISMGSGFYINYNQIITNYHVVKNCRNIAVRGAVKPCIATLQHYDEEKDLAVLETHELPDNQPNKLPYLRGNNDKIKKGDNIISVGYPLERGKTGVYLISPAQIIKVNEHTDGFNLFEFTDSVDHGNSGGPLLDSSLNIIGVVTSRVTYLEGPDKSQSYGSAISISGVTQFLKKKNIPYFTNYTYDIFTNYQVDKSAKNYVVNIHCVH